MRVLITGVSGFAGTHLAEYLSRKRGVELFGLRRPGSKRKAPSKVRLFTSDIRETKVLRRILKKIKPHRVFHLAASASVAQSWREPARTFENNVMGTRALLDGITQECPQARVHVASSAEVYGFCRRADDRIGETAPFRPMNPYAVSKIASEALAQQYYWSHHLRVVRTRAFNHIGPRQSDSYVTSHFAKQVAGIESGEQRPMMSVGNLSAVRDFTDVRDVVRAYWLCLDRGVPGDVYNVCSGIGHRISEILRFYLEHSTVKITVHKNKSLYRRTDAPALVGDPSKLKERTGWKPVFSLQNSLQDILGAWRKEFELLHG